MYIAQVDGLEQNGAGYQVDVQTVPVSATTAQTGATTAPEALKGLNVLGGLIGVWLILALIAVVIVATVLKGMALWRAGQRGHKGWFVALFLLNTAGILEAVYLLTAGKREKPLKQ